MCHHLVVVLTRATAVETATCMQLAATHRSLLANVSVVVTVPNMQQTHMPEWVFSTGSLP